MEKLPSDSDSDSFENELGFVDSTNEISYAEEMNLDNNNLEQQELDNEQITSTTQVKAHDKKKASTYSKRQKRNIENSESETEASTSVWNHFNRKTPPPDKAARGECQVIKNGKKCEHIIDTEGSTSNMKRHLLNVHGLTDSGPISHYSNQMRIDDSFQIVSRNNTKRIASINKALTKFIVLDNQPLSIIYNAEDDVIDYTCLSDAFDDDPDLQDDQDDYDQILTEEEIIQKKLKINSPQVTNGALNKVKIALLKTLDHYWKIPTDEALLATILDPYEPETDASNNNNLEDYEENELLRAMFGSNLQRIVVNEVEISSHFRQY
ncbi:20587_t:CDS:2 [Gigaspora rosea]|nr:20587_t:CDS:2 [Gigaspora rosea]